ncbi:MAG: hypothetical protein GY894_01370 [Planctomycetes bacterium]|jgi:hypothetical protein|nr:hypothetical protein [Planctomycetota bacterium]MCP4838000.1 hypothetical protein [Planctomycetota bacterium]
MIVMCVIAVLTLSNMPSTPSSHGARSSLAVGDALGMQMINVQGSPAPPAIQARAARLAQASQPGYWWQMPDESTVVVCEIAR